MAMATISSPMSRLSVASSPRSLTSPKNLLSSANSTLRQVDYDDDVTPLYEAIGKSEWDKAASLINSQDAATWVVRYERDAQGNKIVPYRIQWRFLPIHSACALNPPASFLRKLVTAYPDGPRTLDDQGLLPLHYACGAKCSREVIYCLLMNFPQSAVREDPNGMLPMHYLAQWGPASHQGQMNMGVLDMVLVSTGDKAANCDHDGNTAERLAMNAEYDGHLIVAKHIASFLHRKGIGSGVDPASTGSSIGSTIEVIRSPKYTQNRPVLKINVGSPRSQHNYHSPFNSAAEDEDTVIEHGPEGNIETSLSTSARENAPRSFSPSPFSTPKSGRKQRTFSWDDHGNHNNGNENNNARDNVSVSGSTWTTHLSNPPKSAPHAIQRHQMSPRQVPPMSPRQALPMSPRQVPPMSPRQAPPMSPRQALPMSPRQAPPMSPRQQLPPMSPRQTGRVSTPKAKAPPQQTSTQPEARQDDESGHGSQSFQSGSTNSTNYSSQLTQQLVEMAEMERREGLESPRANRGLVPQKTEKTVADAFLLEEIARLKVEKERAEADLARARGGHLGAMEGSIMGFSELSPIGEDEMSRLTDHDHDLQHSIAAPSKTTGAAPVVSEIERLEKERAAIDIQLRKAREGPKDPETESLHEEAKDDYKGLFEKEQNEHTSTKTMLEEEKKKHGEDMESHLQEVKSLRESLERATEEISKHQSKELEWNTEREKLEAEIKRLKEQPSQNDDNSNDMSTLTNNSGLDGTVLKMKYENSVKEANDLRKFTANMRQEHNETISQLEGELDRERAEKTKIRSNVVSLEYRISTLEEELEAARSNKSTSKFNSEYIAELEASLQKESSKKYKLQEKVSTLEKDLEDAMSRKKYGSDIDRMAFELHQLKKKLSDKLEEAQKMKELLDGAKKEFERREKNLLQQLDDAQEQLIMVKKKHQDTREDEDSYLQQIRDLKKTIRELQEDDDFKSAKLRETEKTKQRAIQEKEDECVEKIRHLKKEYEEKLQNKEDEYFHETRELKKKMQDGNIDYSPSDFDVNKMIEEKENEFKAEVAKLTAEIETLRQDSQLEAKSDLKSQRRKYRSEINKLENTLEMQKSKEARLEGHIKTLEKQIMDMTAEYEVRIQEYEYGNMTTE
jgi:YD repeat-containing protein